MNCLTVSVLCLHDMLIRSYSNCQSPIIVDAITPASLTAVATVDKWGRKVVCPSACTVCSTIALTKHRTVGISVLVATTGLLTKLFVGVTVHFRTEMVSLSTTHRTWLMSIGAHDWNMQLAEPVIKIIAAPWEKVFSRHIPTLIKKYATETQKKITCFHKEVAEQAGPSRAAHLHLLSGQLGTYADSLQGKLCLLVIRTTGLTCGTGTVNDLVDIINTAQREINREFTPVIMAAMHDSYSWCADERGPGQFMRMKEYMHNHTENRKTDMFEQSTTTVKTRLIQLLKRVEDEMEETTMALYAGMQKDYHSVFGGEAQEAQDFSGGAGRKEREVKNTLQNVLKDFEKPFLLVVGQDVKDDPEPETGTAHQVKVENREGPGANMPGKDIGGVDEAKLEEGKFAVPNIRQQNQDATAFEKEFKVKDEIMDD
jgi:hypothetical protein